MTKEFCELILGDVIWGTEPSIGKHIYILCGDITDEKVDCVTAITVSSTCNKCIDCCIELKNIPNDWFKSTKPVSYIRLEEPRCINASNYEKAHYTYKGNIKKHPTFYDEVCQKCHYLIQNICNCY